MSHWILVIAALLGATAVAAGAFGAHALQGVLSSQARGWYDTAATYHMTHALALLGCALASMNSGHAAQTWFNYSAMCMLAGIVLFSGSLYTMAFTGVTKLGAITPIGGMLLIAGWLCLAIGASRISSGLN